MNLRPKIYKKTLYIGKKKIFKFTKNYASKFLLKVIWILFLAVMLLSILFGGIALTFGTKGN